MSMEAQPPIEVLPIGRVESRERDPGRQDWRWVRSRVRLRPELAPALEGLEGFSHVIVLGWLDRIPEPLRARHIRRHPRAATAGGGGVCQRRRGPYIDQRG